VECRWHSIALRSASPNAPRCGVARFRIEPPPRLRPRGVAMARLFFGETRPMECGSIPPARCRPLRHRHRRPTRHRRLSGHQHDPTGPVRPRPGLSRYVCRFHFLALSSSPTLDIYRRSSANTRPRATQLLPPICIRRAAYEQSAGRKSYRPAAVSPLPCCRCRTKGMAVDEPRSRTCRVNPLP